MAGLRKLFVGIGLAVALGIASGPAALAQSNTGTQTDNTGGNRQAGSSIVNSGRQDQSVRSSGGAGTVGQSGTISTGSSGAGSTSLESTGAAPARTAGTPAAKGAGSKAASNTPASAGSGELARTGSFTAQLALLGFGALLAGCLMVRYSWRPRMLVSASATRVRESLSALADLHARA